MLVNCVAYREGARVADIAVDEIGEWLAQPDCFVWVALHDATPQELAGMQQAFDLHPLAVEDALHGRQRPKVEEYGDSLFVVMRLLEAVRGAPAATQGKADTGDDAEDNESLQVGELDVFAGPNFVVSVRNRSEHSFAGVRARCEREPELLRHGVGFVLYALMDAVVDQYFPVMELLERELETIEQQIFTEERPRESIRRLYGLKRRLMQVRHAVAPLLEGVGRLYGGRVPPICLGVQEYFRDVIDHLNRLESSIDATRDTIGTAIQVNLSMVTIEDGEVTKRLAAWAAIFAISTALAGIWGMNFEHMPELRWRYGYVAALTLIAGLCGYLYWRFRRAGWV